jgi:hypothetical protein
MEPNLPHLHLIVQFKNHRHSAVSQEPFRMFQTLLHHSPNVPLLLDGQPRHDFNQLGYDELWECRVSCEADNNINSPSDKK